jgi:hypothetical protein
MKYKTAAKSYLLAVVFLFALPGASLPEGVPNTRQAPVITAFSYHAGPKDTVATARALALFNAQYRAVAQSAKQLSEQGLLKNYGEQQMEIFCLVAGGLQLRILEQSFCEANSIYTIRIESDAALADFVMAEIKDAAYAKEEDQFSWQEKMDQAVSTTIEPAKELSRAYRYIRKHDWRIAVIYLDHLEKKYPYWDALFLAKALAFEGMDEKESAIRALASACALGDQEACRKVDTIDASD